MLLPVSFVSTNFVVSGDFLRPFMMRRKILLVLQCYQVPFFVKVYESLQFFLVVIHSNYFCSFTIIKIVTDCSIGEKVQWELFRSIANSICNQLSTSEISTTKPSRKILLVFATSLQLSPISLVNFLFRSYNITF